MNLKIFLEENKNERKIELFFDVETLQYNEHEGKEHPSKFRNVVYALGIGYEINGYVFTELFPNFKEFLLTVTDVFKNRKTKPRIELIAHNNNKYDNHFLRSDLRYYFRHMKIKNFWLMTANDEANHTAYKIGDLTEEEKQGVILEKRIKSRINLELTFFLYGVQFFTTDNYMKTDGSIDFLGKKLLRLGVIEKDDLKTDYNYTQYNKSYNMSEEESRDYALEVFNQLSKDEIQYIRNDIFILVKSKIHYSELFENFDYSKMTFTSNILDMYNNNNLTSFQLLNRVKDGEKNLQIEYTNYHIGNENFYDWLKPFYRGGLNYYNPDYVGKTIQDVFGLDINSSYPFAMHNFKIPTFLKDYQSYEKPTTVDISFSNDEYILYEITKEEFDREILDNIFSKVLRQMLVKYYTTQADTIRINSYTFKMIYDILDFKITQIDVINMVTFQSVYFGSRDIIDEYYYIKEQGSTDYKLDYKNPYEINVTRETNTEVFSQVEIDSSKVILNGLYGIPALRPYFNLFRRQGGEFINFENGHKNNERNIVFSIFVTSVALWNLLSPLKYLTEKEIDENFLYCDTDSLYFKEKIRSKIPDNIFNPHELGKWDLEHAHLKNFNVLNHKKYAYETSKGEIKVKSGGIPNDSYDTNMTFNDFIKTQFSHGVEIKNKKSIFNEDETISIYDSVTKLEVGGGYRMLTNDERMNEHVSDMLSEIKDYIEVKPDEVENNNQDILYIESTLGNFSIQDLYPFKHEKDKTKPLFFLEMFHKQILEILQDER